MKKHFLKPAVLVALGTIFVASGCRSPYYQDQGALLGGLTGAGLGAIVGHQTGNTGAGAAIGAGVGALTGSAVGGAIDEVQAENRAAIANQMGRQVANGAATKNEVINMVRAGVDPSLIVNYVQQSGMSAPLSAQDVISLTQAGIPKDVIQAMQTAGPPQSAVRTATVVQEAPVIIERPYYGPYWGPPRPACYYDYHHHGHHGRHRPHAGWGFSIYN